MPTHIAWLDSVFHREDPTDWRASSVTVLNHLIIRRDFGRSPPTGADGRETRGRFPRHRIVSGQHEARAESMYVPTEMFRSDLVCSSDGQKFPAHTNLDGSVAHRDGNSTFHFMG